ncbi:MAG TPA: PQQ-binding-like beta-propeller repeat protein [Gemmatimonadaceae bacterium]|nr:PQQ-binding-like beta-propeller repeat protein [Gemmatimonadaceae bacterium]
MIVISDNQRASLRPRLAPAIVALSLVLGASSCAHQAPPPPPDQDWRVTGGEPGQSRYSPLAQIDRGNVKRLRVAWEYHAGDASPQNRTEIQATPIVVRGVLYATSPSLAAFALHAETGALLWRFDPFQHQPRESHVNRGVVYWEHGDERRVLYVVGRRLYALDAATGKPVPTFGTGGWVDLGQGLGRDVSRTQLVATSPGVIFGDLIIQGTRVSEGEGAAPGHVRAYDVRTGQLRWTFHTVPQRGEPGADTWPDSVLERSGGANSWPGMSVDERRGLVFVPTGSATPDFYGGERLGQNLFANTLLALDARTGKRVWHFQTVHHDIWDRDLPAVPNLLSVVRDGRRVDAVAQITKSGFVFLFDRETGAPLFPVEERPVPASDIEGEHAWATQPIPVKPAPFARQRMTEADLTDLSPGAHAAALARFRTLRHGDLFTPPSREGTVVLPGFDGGGEWGGAAVDRESSVLYVNASDIPWIAALRERETRAANAPPQSGDAVYANNCAGCHRADRRGDGGRTPSLVGVGERRSVSEIRQILERGRGFMPAFPSLTEQQKDAVISYLTGRAVSAPQRAEPAATGSAALPEATPSRFQFVGYERWRDSSGYPAIKPPWGTLSAIDLNTGEYRWRVTLGEHAALAAKGIPPTGTEQYGGPIVTAGGLVFIAATMDAKFRAFDKSTGALLWEYQLPAAGYATPMTYRVGGKQYVVIAAGGGKLGTRSGDSYVAFAIP